MRKWIAFTLFAAVVALVAAPAAAAEGGKELYDQKCAMCHGKDGVAKPIAKGAGNFNDPKWQATKPEAAIVQTITDGKGKMASYKDKLTPEQIKALAAYIKPLAPAK